jgi:hypothetical protein
LVPEKRSRKALRRSISLPKEAEATGRERRRYRLKFLKAIMIVAVLASALTLGACAQKKESMSTTTSAGTTGYSK